MASPRTRKLLTSYFSLYQSSRRLSMSSYRNMALKERSAKNNTMNSQEGSCGIMTNVSKLVGVIHEHGDPFMDENVDDEVYNILTKEVKN